MNENYARQVSETVLIYSELVFFRCSVEVNQVLVEMFICKQTTTYANRQTGSMKTRLMQMHNPIVSKIVQSCRINIEISWTNESSQ